MKIQLHLEQVRKESVSKKKSKERIKEISNMICDVIKSLERETNKNKVKLNCKRSKVLLWINEKESGGGWEK